MAKNLLILFFESAFHGNIDFDEACAQLIDQPYGTYLIRFSIAVPGCYTISYRTDENKEENQLKVKHVRVTHSPGQPFVYHGVKYDSLEEIFVSHKTTYTIPRNGGQYAKVFKKYQDECDSRNEPYYPNYYYGSHSINYTSYSTDDY